MKKIIIANWKCNPESLAQAKKLFNSVKKGVKDLKNLEIVICPPFTYLSSFKFPSFAKASEDKQDSSFKMGAQNCFYQQGAFTGEVSVGMLKDAGAEYVIIGHSERRRNFGETNEMVNKKIKAALKAKLKVILCVGETAEERKQGKTDDVLLEQLEVGLAGIPLTTNYLPAGRQGKLKTTNLLIAYEPLWAIGTGNNCQPQEAGKARLLIQQEIGEKIPIIYGGSVNAKNVKSYLDVGYNGVLIGGASLKSDEFVKTIKDS